MPPAPTPVPLREAAAAETSVPHRFLAAAAGEGPDGAVSPAPLALSPTSLSTMAEIAEAVNAGMAALVAHWPTTPWMQAALPLDPPLAALLQRHSRRPPPASAESSSQTADSATAAGGPSMGAGAGAAGALAAGPLGTLRPDILFAADMDEAAGMRVCEVNARFPLNGFLLTALLARAVLRVGPTLPLIDPAAHSVEDDGHAPEPRLHPAAAR